MNAFKTIIIRHGDNQISEDQFYVGTEEASAEKIMTGDDEGVACLCFNQAMAERIATALNREAMG